MAYIEGHARDQALLLPVSVVDYVSEDNPVRFIDAFVDDLDLCEAGLHRLQPKATGRPGHDPGDMLKLYLSAISTGCGRDAICPIFCRGDWKGRLPRCFR